VHSTAAGHKEDVFDALIGDELKDIVGEFHHLLYTLLFAVRGRELWLGGCYGIKGTWRASCLRKGRLAQANHQVHSEAGDILGSSGGPGQLRHENPCRSNGLLSA
jgi:hypothetical protein